MLQPGAELGRYRIDAPIGAGGMGEVYRARDMTLRRDVAIKVLSADRRGAEEVHEFASRMLNEARAAAALAHPNVVAVYDVGETAGMPYIVLELVHGSPLRRYLQDSSVPLPTKVRWLRDLAAGLGAAHNAGFVHRDVKPANVMITPGGQVKLLDFGIAKRSVTAGHTAGRATLEGPASFQTQDGLIGTWRYMAPEQAAGLPVDARADQYAWGCVAYELLSMLPPMQAASGRMPLARVVPELPPPVAAIVERALSPDRARRYPTMDTIVSELEPFVEGRGSPHPRAYASTPPGYGAPTVQGATTQGSVGPTGPPLLEHAQPYATVPTAPPGYVPPYPAAQPFGQHARPAAAATSHKSIFVFGAGAALVIVVTAGLLLVFRLLDARAAATPGGASASASAFASAAAPATQATPIVPVAASAAKGSGKTPAASPGAAATKAAAAGAPAGATAAGPRCQCQPPTGGRLCKSANPANAACRCRNAAGSDLCPDPGAAASDRTSPCPRFRGALRNGGPCSGFTRGSTNDDLTRAPGILEDCDLCIGEDRPFTGVSQAPCEGLDSSTGAAAAGRLLCF